MYGQDDVTTGPPDFQRPVQRSSTAKKLSAFSQQPPAAPATRWRHLDELVKQTFAAEQEDRPAPSFPLAEIKKLTAGQFIFETAFDFVHFHVYKNLQGCRNLDLAEGHYFEANKPNHLYHLHAGRDFHPMELHIDFNPNELSLAQIQRMNGYYLETLRSMAADPDARYDNFSPLSEIERRQMLGRMERDRPDYPRAVASRIYSNERVPTNTRGDRSRLAPDIDLPPVTTSQILANAVAELTLAPESWSESVSNDRRDGCRACSPFKSRWRLPALDPGYPKSVWRSYCKTPTSTFCSRSKISWKPFRDDGSLADRGPAGPGPAVPRRRWAIPKNLTAARCRAPGILILLPTPSTLPAQPESKRLFLSIKPVINLLTSGRTHRRNH